MLSNERDVIVVTPLGTVNSLFLNLGPAENAVSSIRVNECQVSQIGTAYKCS